MYCNPFFYFNIKNKKMLVKNIDSAELKECLIFSRWRISLANIHHCGICIIDFKYVEKEGFLGFPITMNMVNSVGVNSKIDSNSFFINLKKISIQHCFCTYITKLFSSSYKQNKTLKKYYQFVVVFYFEICIIYNTMFWIKSQDC